MPDLLIYRVGFHPGGSLSVPDMLNNREGPQAREPSKCLNGRAMENDWPKRPSDHQLQEARKKALIGPELLWRRQSMSLHTWCHQGPCKRSSCDTFMLNSHWGRVATVSPASMHAGSLQQCPTLCNPVGCGLPGFSVSERGSPGKYTGVYRPILVVIPF